MFAKQLARPVKALWTLEREVIDRPLGKVKPIGCDTAGEYDLLHIQESSSLEDVKGSHGICVEGGWRILVRRDREHRAEVVDNLGSTRSHRVEHVAKVADVALHDSDRIGDVLDPLL
jgi:hypothetical protein